MAEAAVPLIDALEGSAHFIGALDEFASIAATIARTRAEIASLAPGEIRGPRLRGAGENLEAVARECEAATHKIMEAAETILALAPGAAIEAEALKVFEACAFQDIAGQRLAKVIVALGEIERRMAHFADAMGLAAPDRGGEEDSGPGLDGPRTEQAAVDLLMAGGARRA